jgi:hypothetical protein
MERPMSICEDDDREFWVTQAIADYLDRAPTPIGDDRRSLAHCLQAIHGEGVCMLPYGHEDLHRAHDRRIRLDRRTYEDRREAE